MAWNPPGDWSWANLKNKGQGLLNDPNQLMESPWFNMGMGLLSENSKPFGGNPAQGILGGMKSSKETKEANADRKRIEELRKQLQDMILRQQMAAMGGQQMPGGGWQSPIPGAVPGGPSGGSRAIDQMLQVRPPGQ